jgi:hypothetical protein
MQLFDHYTTNVHAYLAHVLIIMNIDYTSRNLDNRGSTVYTY